MPRVYNFAPGPAMLPETVMKQAQQEFLDWHGTGMSIMEVSHRGKEFKIIVEETERDFRDLLRIPDNYHVLFLQGGARLQFSMVPMNLLNGKKQAVYADTGIWSRYAIEEAKHYCDVKVVTTLDSKNWDLPKTAAYLYYVDNETIDGVEFPEIPNVDLTLVNDMSSNILSRAFDVSRFGLVFACAQKNIAPAGLTLVIVRDDLLKSQLFPGTPSMLRYDIHAKEKSLWNTPPTFAWYMAGLTFKWMKANGGVEAMEKINRRKAEKLYQFIDKSEFYSNSVEPRYRSRMNVPFNVADEKLIEPFLQQAEKNGLMNLKGHRLVGGMRASIYNAMPEAGVDALIEFMRDFEKKHA